MILLRTAIALLALLSFTAAPAAGQLRYMGWGDADSGSRDLSPNCADLPASHELVVSFDAPEGVEDIQKIEAFLDFCTDPFDLLEWWRFDPGSGCRAGSLSVSADFTEGPSTAVDPWEGSAQVDWTYHPGYSDNPVLARVYVTVTPDSPVTTLQTGEETYAFKLIFDNPATGCGGCESSACFIVNGLSITHSGGIYYTSMNYTNYASWQGGQFNCPFVVPVETLTWGSLKARYE